jgi:type II secretory pathway pseudopilin PulG
MIVVLAIAVAISGVVFPLLHAELSDSRISRAFDDTSRIASALGRAARDMGSMPGTDESGLPTSALLTSGPRPDGLPLGRRSHLGDILGIEAPASAPSAETHTPYLGEVGADPWGHAYAVLVPSKGVAGHVWALSAGPDGILQTTSASDALAGDDIGVCLR